MKLIKLESEIGIWYFTKQKSAAEYLEVTSAAITNLLARKIKNVKGYTAEYVNEEVTSLYINPNERGLTHTEWYETTRNRYLNLFRSIVEGKDIKGDY